MTEPQPGATASRRVVRNTAVRSTAEVVAKLASVAFYVVMARKLGEESFGDYMFALSLSSVLLLLAGFGVDDLITRDAAKHPEATPRLWSDAIVIKVVSATVLIGGAALVVNLGGYSSDARAAVYLVGAGNALEVLAWSWHSVFAARERLDLTAVSIIIQRVFTAGVGVALLLAGYGLVAASLVFFLGAILNLAVAHWQLRRAPATPAFNPARDRWRRMLVTSIPLGAAMLMLTALIKIDTVMLSFLSGGDNTEVGYYSAAYRLVEATLFVSWSFTHAMIPSLARSQGPRVPELAALGFKALTAVLTPIGLVLMLFAEPVVELFYGSEFDDAIAPLRLLGAMSIVYGVSYFAATVLVARGQAGPFLRPALLVLAQNVLANLVLIPPLGAVGAAINAVVSGVLLSAVGIWSIRRGSGWFSSLRPFAGPTVAALVSALATIGLSLPLPAAVPVAVVLYAVTAVAFERMAYPSDLAAALNLLRRRIP